MQYNNKHNPSDSHSYILMLHEVINSGNKQLDEKQYIAYEVICTTFLLWLVYDGVITHESLEGYLQAALNGNYSKRWDDLIKKLKSGGAGSIDHALDW